MAMVHSTAVLPEIDRVGEFPLVNPVFEFTYRNPTNVLHLYDYSGQLRINSREFQFRPGDLTCIQSGSVYSFATDAPGRHWCIHFNEMRTLGAATIELPDLVALRFNSVFIREQIKHIASLFNTYGNDAGTALMQLEARHRLKALLLSIHTATMGRRHSAARSRSQLDWDRLMTWIDENLDQPISTVDITELAQVSANTLARRFKQKHKSTLRHYILHKRIDRAKSLLATTTLPVHEVGVSVRIADPQYFNKQFRKVAGTNPSRYRNENREYLTNAAEDLATREGRWQ